MSIFVKVQEIEPREPILNTRINYGFLNNIKDFDTIIDHIMKKLFSKFTTALLLSILSLSLIRADDPEINLKDMKIGYLEELFKDVNNNFENDDMHPELFQ